jgi:hypothetical protein
LIAAAVALYLMRLDVESTSDAVTAVASELRQDNVEGADFDPETARAMIGAMELLIADPEHIASATDDLKTFSDTTAAWAAASPPGTELHVSVLLRRAAGELREHGLRPSDRHLLRAERCLSAGRAMLDDPTAGGGSGGGPGLAVGSIRDQLENLEQAHREQRQEVEEGLRE